MPVRRPGRVAYPELGRVPLVLALVDNNAPAQGLLANREEYLLIAGLCRIARHSLKETSRPLQRRERDVRDTFSSKTPPRSQPLGTCNRPVRLQFPKR